MTVLPKYYLPLAAGLAFGAVYYFPRLEALVWLAPFLVYLYIRRSPTVAAAVFGSWLALFGGWLLILASINPDAAAWQFIYRSLTPAATTWVGLFLIVVWLALAGFLAAPMAFLGLAVWKAPARYQAAVFAVGWPVAEFLRAKIFFGFTWMNLGYLVFGAFPDIGIFGRYLGIYGLSFLAALFAGLAAQSYLEKKISPALALVLVACFVLGISGWWLTLNERGIWQRASISVAVFQGVWPWGSAGPYEKITDGFSLPAPYAKLVSRVEKSARPEIAVFPEEVLPQIDTEKDLYSWYEEKKGLAYLRSSLGANLLVIGQPVKQGNNTLNASVAVGADGPEIFAKRRLFPFIEYIPFGKHLVAGAFRAPPQQFSQGSGYSRGILNCIELLFPEVVRSEVKNGAKILIAGGSEIAWERPVWEHSLLISRFHAMQNRRFLVRAMKEGYSAIVNPLGEIIARSAGKGNEVLIGNVSLVGD